MLFVFLTCQDMCFIRRHVPFCVLLDLYDFYYEDTGYPHDGRADKDSYPHDGRADKDSYPHNRRADRDSYPHDRHNQYMYIILIYNYGYRLASIS